MMLYLAQLATFVRHVHMITKSRPAQHSRVAICLQKQGMPEYRAGVRHRTCVKSKGRNMRRDYKLYKTGCSRLETCKFLRKQVFFGFSVQRRLDTTLRLRKNTASYTLWRTWCWVEETYKSRLNSKITTEIWNLMPYALNCTWNFKI